MPFFQSLGGSPAPVNTMKGCDALGRSNAVLNSKDSRLLPRSIDTGDLLMLLILPPMLKLTGVWLATPVAQVITFVIAWAAKRRVDVNI